MIPFIIVITPLIVFVGIRSFRPYSWLNHTKWIFSCFFASYPASTTSTSYKSLSVLRFRSTFSIFSSQSWQNSSTKRRSLQCRRILGGRKLVNRIATMKPPSLILWQRKIGESSNINPDGRCEGKKRRGGRGRGRKKYACPITLFFCETPYAGKRSSWLVRLGSRLMSVNQL